MRQGNPNDPKRNSEGYADPTAYNALRRHEDKDARRIGKRYLRGYLDLTKDIEKLDNEIKATEEMADNIKIQMNGMPRSTEISDKTGKLATELAEYHLSRMELRSEAWNKRKEIVDFIRSMRRDYSELLYLRYIMDKTFEEIAVETHRSWRHTIRIHGDALEEAGKTLKFQHL